MSTYRQIYYQIIFGTKDREPSINEATETMLYKYVWGIVNNHNCHLYRINSMPDHIHVLTDLHPSIRLSDLVKNIKVASNIWMKESGLFPDFKAWQDGYGAFTYSIREKDMIINYIKGQKEHHRKETFYDEYRRLLKENGIEFDEKYML
ncbi:MAG: IS200/IS605 family transposase [Chitinophagaceae bacterium]|nr:IS200/IS605 family transposase [Chitinophagaceae bacterium]